MVNGEWNVKQAEFQGFVKAKLEDMIDRQDRHEKKLSKTISNYDETHGDLHKRINDNSTEISALNVKSGIFGTIGGILAALAVWLFTRTP